MISFNRNQHIYFILKRNVGEATILTDTRSFLNNAFEKLSTEHRQTIFYKDHGDFVEPEEILDDSGAFRIGYIVPFKNKLRNLLSIPETEFIGESNESLSILASRNIKSNLNDGSYIKEAVRVHIQNRLTETAESEIKTAEKTLYFGVYYDDIEIVNPIGSSTKKHKLGNFNS